MEKTKIIIMGAAGRDFHNFNVRFRNNSAYDVVCFTATQIPYITGKKYPAVLSGPLYPDGIMIYDEVELPELIKKNDVKQCYFSYSDVDYKILMNKASIVQSCNADFVLVGAEDVMIKSSKPVISVCAVRTGCGKSQTTRLIAEMLIKKGLKVAAIRHPMPYGDLAAQECQRYASIEDLKKHKCTIEEMEEYEPHIDAGVLVYAGVDYATILREAEKEVDIILWDGGNNDWSFYKPDLSIVVVDPHRVGHEEAYYPGEVNVRLADVFVINKEDSADPANIAKLVENLKRLNSKAKIAHADSLLIVENEAEIKGKKVLCIEDGPTLTHGQMEYGAAVVAAKRLGCQIVDPRPWVKQSIKDTFDKYPGIGHLMPAMGYSDEQVKDLEDSVNAVECEAVVVGTPIDLSRVINIKKPYSRIRYDLLEKDDVLSTTVQTLLSEKFPGK